MDTEQAKDRLLVHGSARAISKEWSQCFLGQLKPYRGRLDDAIYDDIVNCLKVVFDEVQSGEAIDLRIVAGVHGILHLGRAWVANPESNLRRSGRMPEEEVVRLERWLNDISSIYQQMVRYESDKELFSQYLANDD